MKSDLNSAKLTSGCNKKEDFQASLRLSQYGTKDANTLKMSSKACIQTELPYLYLCSPDEMLENSKWEEWEWRTGNGKWNGRRWRARVGGCYRFIPIPDIPKHTVNMMFVRHAQVTHEIIDKFRHFEIESGKRTSDILSSLRVTCDSKAVDIVCIDFLLCVLVV